MKLHEISPNAGAVKTRKRVGRGIGSGLGKLLVKVIKDKTPVVVEELDLDSKEDNYHYLEDYQKEDSTIITLELYTV